MNLHEIGMKYGTDKATFHNYCRFYQAYLPKSEEVNKFLEIGVLDGKSLCMWAEYYCNALIFGVDIEDKKLLDSDRIRTFIADQSDDVRLREIISHTGDFDVVVDDGGHTMKQQQISLVTLISHTKYYVIEDLCTSLLPMGKDYGVVDEDKTVLSGLIKIMRGQECYDSFTHLSKKEVDYIVSHIDEIYLSWNLIHSTTPLTAIIKTK